MEIKARKILTTSLRTSLLKEPIKEGSFPFSTLNLFLEFDNHILQRGQLL